MKRTTVALALVGASLTAIAVAGCETGTTTVRPVPPSTSADTITPTYKPTDPALTPGTAGSPVTPSPASSVITDAQFGQTYLVNSTNYVNDGAQTYTVRVTRGPVTAAPLFQYGQTPHGTFVAFDVTYVANTEGIEYNAADWYARTADGNHYQMDQAFGGATALVTGTLHKGEKVTGRIAADMPTTHGTLVLQPTSNSGSVAEWGF